LPFSYTSHESVNSQNSATYRFVSHFAMTEIEVQAKNHNLYLDCLRPVATVSK
jgi:hypothetical protein